MLKMFRFRRRHNLRFYVSLAVMVMVVLFITMLVQFNQIENANEKRLKRKPPLNRDEKEKFLLNRYDKLKSQNVRYQIKNPNHSPADLADPENASNDRNEIDFKAMQKSMNSMQRIIHLDLKGSPPKINYLKDLIPYFKAAG